MPIASKIIPFRKPTHLRLVSPSSFLADAYPRFAKALGNRTNASVEAGSSRTEGKGSSDAPRHKRTQAKDKT